MTRIAWILTSVACCVVMCIVTVEIFHMVEHDGMPALAAFTCIAGWFVASLWCITRALPRRGARYP